MPAAIRSLCIALATALTVVACATRDDPAPGPQSVEVFTPTTPQRPTRVGPGINGVAAPAIVRAPTARYLSDADPALVAAIIDPFPPTPKKKRVRSRFVGWVDGQLTGADASAKATQSTIESISTDINISNTGSLFIPADPHGAAGPNHVVSVANVSIEFFEKDGTQDLSTSLQSFFGALSPPNFTFDPKVLYDQYEDRWLVVTLERTDTGSGDAANTSAILLGVSDDSDPNGTWTVTRINTSETITSAMFGTNDHWLDYPGFAVDEEAVYITGNMFQYSGGTSFPGQFGGTRLIIVDKGVSGGFYDGMSVSAARYNPIPGGFYSHHPPARTYLRHRALLTDKRRHLAHLGGSDEWHHRRRLLPGYPGGQSPGHADLHGDISQPWRYR